MTLQTTTKRPMLMSPVLPLALGLLAALMALGVMGYLHTPATARIPVHWGINGQPDRLGGRTEAFLLLPAIGVLLSALLLFLPEWAHGTYRENLEKSAAAWRVSTVGVLALLVMVQVGLNAAAHDAAFPMARLVTATTSLLLVAIGAMLPKTRPNPWMGVRTPWTLRNEVAWTRTHRVAAYGFVGLGLTTAVLAAVAPLAVAFAVLLSGILTLSIWLVLYSRAVCLAEERRNAAPPSHFS